MANLRGLFTRVTFGGVVLSLIFTVILLQLLFLGLGFIFPTLADIKLGFIFYMVAAGLALYFLFKFATKKDTLERRDILYLLLVAGAMIAFFILTKKYIPQMFSIALPSQFQGTGLLG